MRVNVANALKLLCPVCGKGKLFRGYLDTPTKCPSCGFYFMRETGYWLPHAPMSYLVFVGSALFAWLFLSFVVGLASDYFVLFLMLAFALTVAVWANRYTKMLWILLDLTMHPARAEDFEPRGRGN